MKRLPPGVGAALAAALLFGAAAPLAKLLLQIASPWLLAALLYLGSGLGLAVLRALRRGERVRLAAGEWPWFAGAILCGGVAGPVLLLLGLSGLPASQASLLLNAEAVLTALLAWVVFRENVDRHVAAGMACIVAGGVVLAWPDGTQAKGAWPSMLLVVAACLAWAVDNNLTRKVSLADASWLAMVKGLLAGSVNLAIALALGAHWPAPSAVFAAGLLGLASYGVSLVLFVLALRRLGTARTGAYFSVAPFFGALLAVLLLREPVHWQLAAAALLMASGVWLHLRERHEHAHAHEELAHEHEHVHDDAHHGHVHVPPVAPGTRHSHPHVHAPVVHTHPHYPDAHHRHGH
ncbi:DMT family transporter [Ramlibacter sp. XY19]|nr:DMT family transporter [Ramlibacter paludis]